METIVYEERRVYTQSHRKINLEDLKRARTTEGKVERAYFFKIARDGIRVCEIGFNRRKIEAERSGLMVQVKTEEGVAFVSIAGLQRIVEFVADSQTSDFDECLDRLKGKKVNSYWGKRCLNRSLIGISLE